MNQQPTPKRWPRLISVKFALGVAVAATTLLNHGIAMAQSDFTPSNSFAPNHTAVQRATAIDWQKDFETARELAVKTDRLILLHFEAPAWCRPCQNLDRFVFPNSQVINSFQQTVVPMRVDADTQEALVKKFGVTSVPFDVVLTNRGRVISRRKSPRDSEGYGAMLKTLNRTLGILNGADEAKMAAYEENLNELEELLRIEQTAFQEARDKIIPNKPEHLMPRPSADSSNLKRRWELSQNKSADSTEGSVNPTAKAKVVSNPFFNRSQPAASTAPSRDAVTPPGGRVNSSQRNSDVKPRPTKTVPNRFFQNRKRNEPTPNGDSMDELVGDLTVGDSATDKTAASNPESDFLVELPVVAVERGTGGQTDLDFLPPPPPKFPAIVAKKKLNENEGLQTEESATVANQEVANQEGGVGRVSIDKNDRHSTNGPAAISRLQSVEDVARVNATPEPAEKNQFDSSENALSTHRHTEGSAADRSGFDANSFQPTPPSPVALEGSSKPSQAFDVPQQPLAQDDHRGQMKIASQVMIAIEQRGQSAATDAIPELEEFQFEEGSPNAAFRSSGSNEFASQATLESDSTSSSPSQSSSQQKAVTQTEAGVAIDSQSLANAFDGPAGDSAATSFESMESAGPKTATQVPVPTTIWSTEMIRPSKVLAETSMERPVPPPTDLKQPANPSQVVRQPAFTPAPTQPVAKPNQSVAMSTASKTEELETSPTSEPISATAPVAPQKQNVGHVQPAATAAPREPVETLVGKLQTPRRTTTFGELVTPAPKAATGQFEQVQAKPRQQRPSDSQSTQHASSQVRIEQPVATFRPSSPATLIGQADRSIQQRPDPTATKARIVEPQAFAEAKLEAVGMVRIEGAKMVDGQLVLPGMGQGSVAPSSSVQMAQRTSGQIAFTAETTSTNGVSSRSRVSQASVQRDVVAGVRPRIADNKYALQGNCPITLLSQGKWEQGDREIGVVHRRQVYLFVDEAAREKFQQDPDLYSPLLAGYDPVLYHETGKLVKGSEQFGVFMGKLPNQRVVLFTSADTQAQFRASPKKFIETVRQAMSK